MANELSAAWAAVAAPFVLGGLGWMFMVERRLGALGRVEKQLDKLVKHFLPTTEEE